MDSCMILNNAKELGGAAVWLRAKLSQQRNQEIISGTPKQARRHTQEPTYAGLEDYIVLEGRVLPAEHVYEDWCHKRAENSAHRQQQHLFSVQERADKQAEPTSKYGDVIDDNKLMFTIIKGSRTTSSEMSRTTGPQTDRDRCTR